MRRLHWARQARRDLSEIRAFWEDRRPDYIAALLTAAADAAKLLLDNPGIGSPTPIDPIRKWPIGRTPYLLFYRFTRAEIRILRVRHERQDWPVELAGKS